MENQKTAKKFSYSTKYNYLCTKFQVQRYFFYMKYAIIAAGEGSRLAAEGVAEHKPLVRVHGECLVDRLLRIFASNGADDIFVICNEQYTDVASHLERLEREGLDGQRIPLRHIVKSTPSSMHSFFELSKLIGEGPVVLTTVDTIFRPDDFAKYIAALEKALAKGYDGMMGVTDYVDDEKPLYVSVDSGNSITGFHDLCVDGCRYVSGGIYGLNTACLKTLADCMEKGVSRMRNFQRALVVDDRRLLAFPFTKVLDIDHASDKSKAEQFLAE